MITLSTALKFKIWSQDATQAYIQGHQPTRSVYMKPTKYFGLPHDQLIKLLKELYELTKSGGEWFHTYNKYLNKVLKI